jgi:glyoxylase-like metal-dependent hydrolase (beta-lactamase superfamily II)
MSDIYFRQLLAGRDYAVGAPAAREMLNFVYLIGDRAAGEAMVVDPAYAPGELIDLAAADGMKLTGALVTHYHADHAGGSLMGISVAGLRELLEHQPMPIHVQRDEAPWIQRAAGVPASELVLHSSGDIVEVGQLRVHLIHTPGHTPGSQCFFVDNRLIAGDTLFLQGCGRTDLPGGDPRQMYESLTQRLAAVPDEAVLFPGHQYAPRPSADLGETRRGNAVFKPKTAAAWLELFG